MSDLNMNEFMDTIKKTSTIIDHDSTKYFN